MINQESTLKFVQSGAYFALGMVTARLREGLSPMEAIQAVEKQTDTLTFESYHQLMIDYIKGEDVTSVTSR